MARIEVQHLRYRGEAVRAGQVEFALADALRTEIVDDGRLVLVRSFALGRTGLSQQGASRAAASAWRAIREGARHGGASGAESANCVWFADVAEARVLLMRELARGRTPFAWFWGLAVPDWRRDTLERWLERRFAEAVRDASGDALAALVAEAQAAGAVEVLAAVILGGVPPLRLALPPTRPRQPQDRAAGRTAPRSSEAPALQLVDGGEEQTAVLAVVRAIPAPIAAVLSVIGARSELATFVEALIRGLVLRAHPALALAPRRVAAIAQRVAVLLRSPPSQRADPAPGTETGNLTGAAVFSARGRRDEGTANPRGEPNASPELSEIAGEDPVARPPSTELAEERLVQPSELRSAAAGVLLAIVPLIRLGWREWLTAHPELLVHQPGARLLRRIAAHYRVADSDPLWEALPAIPTDDDPPPELEQALHFWRKGLDGWLRRRARLRLADLVLRQGWILPAHETTLVRFPLNAIEIRLRRMALDSDPGWVDWLGHAYRVVYGDRPAIGSRLA